MWDRKCDNALRRTMAAALVIVGALIAIVIFFFAVLRKQQQEEAFSSVNNTEQSEIILDDGSSSEKEDAGEAGVLEENGEVYLIKGKDKGSNRYERSAHLSYTDSVRYTWEELSWLDSYGLRITRNEIYARHGRMFSDQDIQDYFNQQDWYVAQASGAVFDESCLNEVESYNVELIRSYELQQGY